MTPEEQKMLKRTYVLAQKNNEILDKLHRSMRNRRILRVFHWVIIIGLALGSFYFVQPYLETVLGTYSSLFGDNDSQNNTLDLSSGSLTPAQIQNLLQQLN